MDKLPKKSFKMHSTANPSCETINLVDSNEPGSNPFLNCIITLLHWHIVTFSNYHIATLAHWHIGTF